MEKSAQYKPLHEELKMDRFVEAVNKEVKKEVDAILRDAEASKREILADAGDEVIQTAFQEMQHDVKKMAMKYEKMVAKAELDSKKSVLHKKGLLTRQVMENVRGKLKDFTESEGYFNYLVQCLEGASLTGDAVLILRPEDMRFAEQLQKKAGVSCECKEDESITLGGLSIYYPQKGTLLERTLDSRLEEQREIFNRKNCFSLE